MTRPGELEATVKAIANHGAAFVGANVMFLKEGTRDNFLGFIRSEFPQMVEGSRSSTPVRAAPPRLRRLDPAMVSTLQKRYNLERRQGAHPRQW